MANESIKCILELMPPYYREKEGLPELFGLCLTEVKPMGEIYRIKSVGVTQECADSLYQQLVKSAPPSPCNYTGMNYSRVLVDLDEKEKVIAIRPLE